MKTSHSQFRLAQFTVLIIATALCLGPPAFGKPKPACARCAEKWAGAPEAPCADASCSTVTSEILVESIAVCLCEGRCAAACASACDLVALPPSFTLSLANAACDQCAQDTYLGCGELLQLCWADIDP